MADTKRRVLVTGGGRGLGSAIVKLIAAGGHDVTFTYRSAAAEAEALVQEMTAAHPQQSFKAHQADLSDKAAVDALLAILDTEGPYSGFVHNAGQSYDTLAVMVDQAKAEAAMQVNFWSFTRLATVLVKQMMRAKDGRIAVIGSVMGERGNQGNAIYGASKAALLGYVRALAVEVASRNITVNYIAPGFIDTDMISKYAKFREKMESQIPAKRFAAPEDVAGIVGFLMSPGAAYITGASIPVDGGLMAAIGIHR
jgi:NAD(P)-dependent dehydrogenase (short-subunit alcohol dehydrogenase family)